jgi:hypothetical protein
MAPDLHSLLQQEIDTYQILVRETNYQPPIWILPGPSCELLKKLGEKIGPQAQAFEFGSGRSTIALRSVCSGVTSVEDSAEWLQKTEALPDQVPRRKGDLTVVVPLTTCRLGLVPFKSFDLTHHSELLRQLQTADLILVDSPPNPATRENALFTALQQAKPGALILLDDLDVPATKRFAQRLARTNPGCLEFLLIPIDHELGLFQKTAALPISYSPSLREILGAWRRS